MLDEDALLQTLYDEVYSLFEKDEYQLVNLLLTVADVPALPSSVLLGFLTITAGQADKLPARQRFGERVATQLIVRHGRERAAAMLVGVT